MKNNQKLKKFLELIKKKVNNYGIQILRGTKNYGARVHQTVKLSGKKIF